MTEEDEQIIEDVKYILRSGDAEIIRTLRVTIPAYLEYIAVNRRHAELKVEYIKEIEQDSKDYRSALAIKKNNKTWTTHENLKKDLGL
jgi:hypothetical protein